jgi:hypothetical protein
MKWQALSTGDLTAADRKFLARLLEFMRSHRGAATAVTGPEIARYFGFTNDRIIRDAFVVLTAQGYLIASSVHQPTGFYLVETPEEAEIYSATLKSRAVKTLKRLRDFNRAAGRRFGPARQEPLFTLEPAIKELEKR